MADDDRAARFRALVLPELVYLHRLGVVLAGNRPAGEDFVEESILSARRYFDSYDGDGFRAWMAAIMRNRHHERPRAAPMPTDDEWPQSIPDLNPNPEQLALNSDSAARLRGIVAGLPEALREVLVLREFCNLSYTHIAATLKVPTRTVMSRLSRARDDLRTARLTDEKGSTS